MTMIAILSLLREMRSASHGGHNALFPNVACVSDDIQYGHKNIAGLQCEWSPILSSLLRERHEFFLNHIFIMMLSIVTFILWRLSHDTIPTGKLFDYSLVGL